MKTGSKLDRFYETKKILDYGFKTYSKKTIFPAGYKIQDQQELPVVKGKQKTVGIETQKPLTLLVKNGEENEFQPVYQLDQSILKDKSLVAPLEKGQAVGYLTAEYKGTDKYGYLTSDGNTKVPVVTVAAVKKASWIALAFRSLVELISHIFKG
jgi:D-alanyl-D-alanine carboxypeptidase (penicillin-binding protein 5/6)